MTANHDGQSFCLGIYVYCHDAGSSSGEEVIRMMATLGEDAAGA